MISPWEIYWVMQLDAINTFAGLASFTGIFAVMAVWGFVLSETDGLVPRIAASALTAMWAIVLAVAVFLPTSKTAAAMIVIPDIANNERFQAEASDLYDLAKQGLKKIVATDEEKPESK